MQETIDQLRTLADVSSAAGLPGLAMTVRLAAHALNGDATALTDVRALFAHKIEHMTGERSDERIALWKRAAEIAEGNRT